MNIQKAWAWAWTCVFLVLSLAFGSTSSRAATCRETPTLPALSRWACALAEAMAVADAGAAHRRSAEVVAGKVEMQGVLDVTSADGDVVCESVARGGIEAVLRLMASRQRVRGISEGVTDAARAEIGKRATRETIEVCESVTLVEGDGKAIYWQAEHFRIANVREGQDFVVVVKTTWRP